MHVLPGLFPEAFVTWRIGSWIIDHPRTMKDGLNLGFFREKTHQKIPKNWVD